MSPNFWHTKRVCMYVCAQAINNTEILTPKSHSTHTAWLTEPLISHIPFQTTCKPITIPHLYKQYTTFHIVNTQKLCEQQMNWTKNVKTEKRLYIPNPSKKVTTLYQYEHKECCFLISTSLRNNLTEGWPTFSFPLDPARVFHGKGVFTLSGNTGKLKGEKETEIGKTAPP